MCLLPYNTFLVSTIHGIQRDTLNHCKGKQVTGAPEDFVCNNDLKHISFLSGIAQLLVAGYSSETEDVEVPFSKKVPTMAQMIAASSGCKYSKRCKRDAFF